MPEQSGIEFLVSLGDEAPFVIFTTAFGDFAFEAFELNAVHYLLKPFDKKKFAEAIRRAIERITSKHSKEILSKLKEVIDSEEQQNEYVDKVSVKSKNKIILVPVDEIVYLQADKNYILINTKSSQFKIRETLGKIQEKLNPVKFIRVHKSFIVNKNFILELEPVFNQEYLLKLTSGKKIPTGSTYKDIVKKIIN
jgi:two-component system LytT family response regulator